MLRKLQRTARKLLAYFLILTIFAVNLLWTAPAYALGGVSLKSSVIANVIDEYSMELAPGVSEKRYSYEDTEGKRIQAFVVNIDMKNPEISIEASTPDNKDAFGLQTVRDQANCISSDGHRVVAAVNGDYFNMATGEPFGTVYKNGRAVIPNLITPWRFFAITKEGKPIICDTDYLTGIAGDVKEAIGGQAIIVKDGKIFESSPFDKGRNPRTGVGIKTNGDVFFVAIDGRQAPYSSGITSDEFAQLMIDLGAQTALDFDGGGSTTYVSRKPGGDELQLVNSPSDGRERRVANSWLIVSTAKPDHVFNSAYVEPYDKSYTPGSTVQFSFKGRDKSLAPAPAPSDGLTWELSDPAFGTIGKDGKFVSNGKTGEVKVSLKYLGKVVGSTYIEIRNPDEIHFSSQTLSVAANSTKQLELAAAFSKRVLSLKSSDIEWNVSSGLGSVDSNGVLHVSDKPVSGKITARYKGSSLVTSIDVKIIKSPEVLYGFEEIYKTWKASVVGRGEKGYSRITSSSYGPVQSGKRSLKVYFDFTKAQTSATLGVYAGPGRKIPIPGDASSIGMWVYGTPEAKGYWLRMGLIDGSGNMQYLNLTSSTPGIDWTGWKYIEIKIPSGLTGPLYIHPNQAIRIMSTNSGVTGPMTKGSVYIDNIRAVFGV